MITVGTFSVVCKDIKQTHKVGPGTLKSYEIRLTYLITDILRIDIHLYAPGVNSRLITS